MINWKVRLKSKTFWVTAIPTALLLMQQILALFGITFDFTDLSNQLVNIVDTVFVLLAICGVVIDHTTAGVSDSKLALTYDEPKEDYKV